MVKTPCKYHDTKFSIFSEKMALRSQNLTSHFFNGVLGLHLKNGDILRQLFFVLTNSAKIPVPNANPNG